MNQAPALRLQFVVFIAIIILSGCSTAPVHPKQASYTLQDTQHTTLAKGYQRAIRRHKGHSGFVLLGSGLDAFAARTALFRKAEKSIDVQYFLVRNDLTGHLFYQALVEAADRGVRVRILLDDQYLARRPSGLAALDKHSNIEIRVFNPYSRRAPRLLQYVFRLGEITRRMHNKSVIIDNTVTIIGSRNIGNEYSEAKSKRVFSGIEALAAGPIVKAISASFDRYWNFPKTVDISRLALPGQYTPEQTIKHYDRDPIAQAFSKALETSALVKQIEHNVLPFRWAKARLIVDEPEKIILPRNRKGQFLKATQFQPFIQNTTKEILILTPYFIPGEEGLHFFRELRNRGITINVLTNSYASTDVELVNAHYNKYRSDLLKMGVNVYEFKSKNGGINLLQRVGRMMSTYPSNVKAGLHAKVFSFDQNNLYIGSLNLDPRSLYENTEIGVMISSSDITKTITQWFDKHLDELAYHVKLKNNQIIWEDYAEPRRTLRVEPDTTPSQRLLMNLLSVLPVESQL